MSQPAKRSITFFPRTSTGCPSLYMENQGFKPGSKYDYVDVNIAVTPQHRIVFSRFVISRLLRSIAVCSHHFHTRTHLIYTCRVSERHSQEIALELKKRLVDSQQLEITQDQLDRKLFDILNHYGYGSEYFSRYRMMNSFFRERIPLMIIISGTGCIGKHIIATRLAHQFNLPNVLHTALVSQIMARFFGLHFLSLISPFSYSF